MTQTNSRPVPFGRALGEAYRSADALHLRALEQAGTAFDSWVVFTLLGDHDGAAARPWLIADLARRLRKPATEVDEHLDGMLRAGFLRIEDAEGEARVAVTEDGAALFARARALVAELTEALVGAVKPAELATVVRVLREVDERAQVLARR
ncbi:MAG: hypothetical protein GEU80_13795 [Dehalococcoidia bacterium]|nr:hypothetical protein [Dehalococcoidia bacterium]